MSTDSGDDRLINSLRAGIGRLPHNTADARQGFYKRIIESMRAASPAGDSHAQQAEVSVRTAIAAVEAEFTDVGFVAPDDRPTGTVHYLWLQLTAGCGTLTAIIDLIKPITNLQTLAAVGGVILAVLLSAAMRLWPAWRNLFANLRLASLATVGLMVLLFGVDVILPDGAPKGVIAQVVPQVSDLQDMLFDLRDPIERTAANTDAIAKQTEKIGQTLDQIVLGQDPGVVAQKQNDAIRKQITDAGYTLDAQGLADAIVKGDQIYGYFTYVGVTMTPAVARATLLSLSSDLTQWVRVRSALVGLSPAVQQDLNADLAPLAPLHTQRGGFNQLRAAACRGEGAAAWADWLLAIFKRGCDDEEAQWLGATRLLLQHLGDQQWHQTPYIIEAASPTILKDIAEPPVSPMLGRWVGQFRYEGDMLVLFDQDFDRRYTGGSAISPKKAECADQLCSGSVDILYMAADDYTIVDVAFGKASELLTRNAVAAMTAGFGWSLIYNPDSDGSPLRPEFFIARYDAASRAGISFGCLFDGTVITYAMGIGPEQMAEMVLRVNGTGAGPLTSFWFDSGNELRKETMSAGRYTRSLAPDARFLNEMIEGNWLDISAEDGSHARFDLTGFSAALSEFEGKGGCY